MDYLWVRKQKLQKLMSIFCNILLVCIVEYVGADYVLSLLKIFKISTLPLTPLSIRGHNFYPLT